MHSLAPLLERALGIRLGGERDPAIVAETKLALARALWDARGDRARALALAEQARAAWSGAPGRTQELGEAEAWLRRSRPAR